MLPESYRWIIEQFEPEGDPWQLFHIAQDLEQSGHDEGAASVYDRAFGIDPSIPRIQEARAKLLNRLAVLEHGLCFRYIPAGPFLMGSRDGEPDEQPLHPVWLDAFWMAEVPTSWADFCRLMGWETPPQGGWPRDDDESFDAGMSGGVISYHRWAVERTKVTSHYCYCEDNETWQSKPMVAVCWAETEELARRLSGQESVYSLPTEAQWEKAARGGLIGARYPWGDEPPTRELCDFGHYGEFVLAPSKSLPPNGYGVYSMSGGVWEWTRDWYDRDGYRESADHEPHGPAKGKEKVMRGGSWADCGEVVTVSFRQSQPITTQRWVAICPMFGFRLCRKAIAQGAVP
jgi:formylglycine-generating enzyme required for sulfatase activity